MGKETGITWTHHTANFWRGCTKVSPGCANCYADAQSRRNPAVLGIWGPQGKRVVAVESYWQQPLIWDRAARAAGERRRVFSLSLGDWLEDWTGPMSSVRGEPMAAHRHDPFYWIVGNPGGDGINGSDFVPLAMDHARLRLLDTIRRTPDLDWLLLTKRPENWWRLLKRAADLCEGAPASTAWDTLAWIADWLNGRPPANVWVGFSAEDQERFDERVGHAAAIPAVVHFVSCEPLLGPVDPRGWHAEWAIIGGESGPGRRECDVEWIESTARRFKAVGRDGAAVYVKQDSGPRDGMQGRIPDDLWSVKDFPAVPAPGQLSLF